MIVGTITRRGNNVGFNNIYPTKITKTKKNLILQLIIKQQPIKRKKLIETTKFKEKTIDGITTRLQQDGVIKNTPKGYSLINYSQINFDLKEAIRYGLYEVFSGEQNKQGILYLNKNQFVEENCIKSVAGEIGINPNDDNFRELYFKEVKIYRQLLINYASKHYNGGLTLPKDKVNIGELVRKDFIERCERENMNGKIDLNKFFANKLKSRSFE